MAGSAGGSIAQITSQTETVNLDDTGRAVTGWRVYYRLLPPASGGGSVFIPKTEYTSDEAMRRVRAEAEQLVGAHRAEV